MPPTETIAIKKSPTPLSSSVIIQDEESPLIPETRVRKRLAINVTDFDTNVDQKLITTTEDKALLCLSRNLKKLGKRRWVHPFSLLMTFLLSLATSDFMRIAWISPDLLKAIFIVASLVTTGWLVWELIRSSHMKELPEIIDDIFSELRGHDHWEEEFHFNPQHKSVADRL